MNNLKTTIMEEFIKDIGGLVYNACQIDKTLFDEFGVKRGLRNADGTGVIAGLTNVGDVIGYVKEDGKVKPVEGNLRYRGYPVTELVKGFQADKRHGFDETTFLLLTGKLPSKAQLNHFSEYLAYNRDLDEAFTNMILSLRGKDMMNMLARSILILYTLDETAEDYSHLSLLNQSLSLIAKLPVIVAYSYHGMRHAYSRKTLVIRHPRPNLSPAENFLYMIKGCNYTALEAEILDLALVLHAEHGGGNNSTFVTRVVSSSMTDTYSAIAAGVGSLKGRLHGGANLQVLEMMEDIKAHVKDWTDENEVKNYLGRILKSEVGDKSGKIYGIGHAVYTLSDPRTILLKEKGWDLAREKGLEKEFALYDLIERLAPKAFHEFKGETKVISANVDFYSGFVYETIGIPKELFTPIFAISRMAGWAAHRLEEVTFSSKRIIRPAYKNVAQCELHYAPLATRK
ncbi:MAG TPA: citrate synthase [Marinilabiliales bacterium]|jgi:citrate synthase|nr:citrate synthase [Marinilabiliales bacterium]